MAINSSLTPEQLVNNILMGGGVQATNITYTGAPGAIAKFDSENQAQLFESGVVLTTGNASTINTSNNLQGYGVRLGLGGDADLEAQIPSQYSTYDATVLEFTFIPTETPVRFSYVFGSEEYNEYVCTPFNDVFGFFVTGANPSGGTYQSQNVAKIPGTNENVAINAINNGTVGTANSAAASHCTSLSNSQYYYDNGASTFLQYDGLTVQLESVIDVIPGQAYTIKIAIADVGDGAYDSGVFLKAGSFSSPVLCTNDLPEISTLWYVGYGKGAYDFNTNQVLTEVLDRPAFEIFEAISTVTSPSGNLLFYTDGLKVYDASHNQMPNGGGLLGSQEYEATPFFGSSLNGALSINMPGNPNKYYVFTTQSTVFIDEHEDRHKS